ncbi:hypothetical protein C1646_731968 [Rhizophagus diaphanus]|nr:hypothetical protein C1646_731968 [Rhizophagus diaphanus] [Rhizophagus sp. MUCL 43196]
MILRKIVIGIIISFAFNILFYDIYALISIKLPYNQYIHIGILFFYKFFKRVLIFG